MRLKQTVPIILSSIVLLCMSGCDLKQDTNAPVETNPNDNLPVQNDKPHSVNLGSASKFVVLAGSEIVNTGKTSIVGDIGISPGNSYNGFPPGTLEGNTFIKDGENVASDAQKDLSAAYKNATALSTEKAGALEVNLGGLKLYPGLYHSISYLEVSSGDLTLDAKGDTNGVFILKAASSLLVASGSKVSLIGGAQAKNIYWIIGTSATLDSASNTVGNIIAEESIILNKGASLNGRALSKTGRVKLASSTIVRP